MASSRSSERNSPKPDRSLASWVGQCGVETIDRGPLSSRGARQHREAVEVPGDGAAPVGADRDRRFVAYYFTRSVRVAEKLPVVPVELVARTRQNRFATGSVDVLNAEPVTAWFTTVELNVLDVLTWIV